MEPLYIVLITIAALVALKLVVLLALAGGDTSRIGLAWTVGWKAILDPAFGEKVRPLLSPPTIVQTGPPKPSGVPLRLVALLEREARLLDFLMENIQDYKDADIGAGVRDIHRRCQQVINEHLVLEPVINQEEETAVEVPAGFDPSAVRLTGNVTGQPPFRGILKHRGWRVKDVKLAAPPEGQDELVLMPAEVEMP